MAVVWSVIYKLSDGSMQSETSSDATQQPTPGVLAAAGLGAKVVANRVDNVNWFWDPIALNITPVNPNPVVIPAQEQLRQTLLAVPATAAGYNAQQLQQALQLVLKKIGPLS